MTASFPKGKTAFLVIHGIGEQNPFETLDSFSRGMIDHLRSQSITFHAEHRLTKQSNAEDGSWTESYVRLKPTDSDDIIDIHEYYWAYLTEEKISVPEVWEWVEKTLQGTRRFYRENKDLQRRYEKNGKVSYKLEKVASWCLRFLSLIYPIVRLLSYIMPSWARNLENWLKMRGAYIIKGYIGDIAIYTTMDKKSRFFKIRQQILVQCQTILESIIADPQYERIIIAGHSLGSVISYDTLNRLNIKTNMNRNSNLPVEKIKGLVTFGSPLDKIAFFFREHAGKEEYIRRQIMEHFHSFKAKSLSSYTNGMNLSNPIEPLLDKILWINYYNEKDPISGHLDFYKVDENIEIDLPGQWGVAHIQYWDDRNLFYKDITERFLTHTCHWHKL
ncbi:MAG: hypothetical protein QME49_06355 [bacterium]|nr:hypothetical protein [bacterium]